MFQNAFYFWGYASVQMWMQSVLQIFIQHLKQTHFWGIFSFTSNVNIWHNCLTKTNKSLTGVDEHLHQKSKVLFLVSGWILSSNNILKAILPTAFKYQRQIILNIDLNIILNTRLLLTHTGKNLWGKKKIGIKWFKKKKINSLIIIFSVINHD